MLINDRIKCIENCVTTSINNLINYFSDKNDKIISYKISLPIINEVNNKLTKHIYEWKGIRFDLLKPQSNEFLNEKKYFDYGKNWLDQTKVKIMGNIFWLPIVSNILEYIHNIFIQYSFVTKFNDYNNTLLFTNFKVFYIHTHIYTN